MKAGATYDLCFRARAEGAAQHRLRIDDGAVTPPKGSAFRARRPLESIGGNSPKPYVACGRRCRRRACISTSATIRSLSRSSTWCFA